MRSIHPFPARMAPDTIADLLESLPKDATVLDPMCGSGVVVRLALLSGRKALGFDIDPLAVLMSKVWTSHKSLRALRSHAVDVVSEAAAMKLGAIDQTVSDPLGLTPWTPRSLLAMPRTWPLH